MLFDFGYDGGDLYTAAADGDSLRLLNREDLVIKRADAEDVYMNSPDVSSDGAGSCTRPGSPQRGGGTKLLVTGCERCRC